MYEVNNEKHNKNNSPIYFNNYTTFGIYKRKIKTHGRRPIL